MRPIILYPKISTMLTKENSQKKIFQKHLQDQ